MKRFLIFFIFVFFFSLNIHIASADLKKVNTEDLISIIENSKGKVLILMFWSIQCPLCVKELSVLEDLNQTYDSSSLKIVSVCLDSDTTKVNKFLIKKKIDLPVLIGKEDVKTNFNILGVPKIYIFDKENRLVKRQIGYIDRSSLINIVKSLI